MTESHAADSSCTCVSHETDWSPEQACAGIWTTPVNRDGVDGTPTPPECCEVHMKPWGHRRGCPVHDPNAVLDSMNQGAP